MRPSSERGPCGAIEITELRRQQGRPGDGGRWFFAQVRDWASCARCRPPFSRHPAGRLRPSWFALTTQLPGLRSSA